MDILRNIVAIIFYILFFTWLLLKMINIILINRLECKEHYQEIKRNLKCKKIYKYLAKTTKIVTITILAVIGTYLMIAIVVGAIALFMVFITLGGTAYVDTGADSSFYNYLMTSIGIYFSGFKYIISLIYVLYITVYLFLANGIYINYLSYKALKKYKRI